MQSTSESMRVFIRSDEKFKAEEQLEAKLLEGLNSHESELDSTEWGSIRKEAHARLKSRKRLR
ncbi:MAG: hypothetical protein H7829_17610 [Magnetococcus sp. THC-1_WYH]